MQCVSCESAAHAAALLSSDPTCFVYFLLPIPWQLVEIFVPHTFLWQLVSGSYSSWAALNSLRFSWWIVPRLGVWFSDASSYMLAAASGVGKWVLAATWPTKTWTSFAVYCLHHNRDTCSSPCWLHSYLIMHLCMLIGWLSMRLRLAMNHPGLKPKFKCFLAMETLAMFAAMQHRPVQEPYRVVLAPKAKLWTEKLWAALEKGEQGCTGCLDVIFVKIIAWRIANSYCTSLSITWVSRVFI